MTRHFNNYKLVHTTLKKLSEVNFEETLFVVESEFVPVRRQMFPFEGQIFYLEPFSMQSTHRRDIFYLKCPSNTSFRTRNR